MKCSNVDQPNKNQYHSPIARIPNVRDARVKQKRNNSNITHTQTQPDRKKREEQKKSDNLT